MTDKESYHPETKPPRTLLAEIEKERLEQSWLERHAKDAYWYAKRSAKDFVHFWQYGLWDFLERLWYYLPAIWHDVDFDYFPLLYFMELKLRRMGDPKNKGITQNWDKCQQQMRTAAELCRRLREGEYFREAGYDHESWEQLLAAERKRIADLSGENQKNDKRYLGMLIGKYIDHWWD